MLESIVLRRQAIAQWRVPPGRAQRRERASRMPLNCQRVAGGKKLR